MKNFNPVARIRTTTLLWLMFKQFVKGSPMRIRTWRGNRVNVYPQYNFRHAVIRLFFQLFQFFSYNKPWFGDIALYIVKHLMTYDEFETYRVDIHRYGRNRKENYNSIVGYFNGITRVEF